MKCSWSKYIGALIVIFGLTGCANGPMEDKQREKIMTEQEIREAQKTHTAALMATKGVVGVGQGLENNKPCIVVMVVEKNRKLEKKISSILKGIPHRIDETGVIRAFPEKSKN